MISVLKTNYKELYNRTPTYIVVDFSLPSTEKRFFIYKNNKLVFSTYVAHGSGSGRGVYATSFSNRSGSHQSSLGTYRLGEFYYGKYGRSMRVDGLSKTNSNARSRAIVIHPAPYIGNGRTGNSWGCFAIPTGDVSKVFSLIKPGDYLYARR